MKATTSQEQPRTHPSVPITDRRFEYRPSDKTDVRITWARFGWKPIERKE